MNTRWDNESIEYTDIDKLKAALVGRSIVSTTSEGADYDRVLTFTLDDGTALRAHAAHGGCACSNGCFTVAPGNVVRGTILNVEVEEEVNVFDYDTRDYATKKVEPGSVGDGEAKIRLFVYTDLGQSVLVESEGGDNGYYGWGFWLSLADAAAAVTR